MESPVIIETLSCHADFNIGYIQLNAPKTLNALSMKMISVIYPQLLHWQADDNIVAVFIEGAGDKAFCAGGDVVSLYHSLIQGSQNDDQSTALAEQYFTHEYQLDFLIHQYKKPVIVWGNGIVMGGGVGLMAGASHRIVTENTKLAMPEVSIGLFPDVCGSYFLNAIPNKFGVFVGLTGAMLNAEDVIYSGLADLKIGHTKKALLVDALRTLEWSKKTDENHQSINLLLSNFSERVELAKANLKRLEAELIEALKTDILAEIIENILAINIEDKWLNRAQQSLNHGSPLSIHLIYRQLIDSRELSVADCFRSELNLALHCCRFGDFKEGVRALLVEKDRKPKWQYTHIKDVEDDVVEQFFEPIWGRQQHPLSHLS